jgi:muramoyltetrapeptide carboxypeptidase
MKKLIINLAVLYSLAFSSTLFASEKQNILPKKLKRHDTVGLVSSASREPSAQEISFAKERLEKMGLKVVFGKYIYRREGYFAGTDLQRAKDLNSMFVNPKIKAIFEIRGGWGSDRILPYLNYKLIKRNPKIIVGFSDITALLIAIHKKTGLVTFHGPLGVEPWPPFTVNYMKQVLFEGGLSTFSNPTNEFNLDVDIIQTKNRIQTIQSGTATGSLVGGNLSVLVTLLGTKYEPNWKNKILFVEDVGESNYQIDRMLSHLELAGVFKKIKGFIFGKCTRCTVAKYGYGSFTIKEIISHYVKPRHLPAFMGSMIGHEPKIFTLPEGVLVEVDADLGTIKMLKPAVI